MPLACKLARSICGRAKAQSLSLIFKADGKIVGYSGYVLADSARLALPPVGT